MSLLFSRKLILWLTVYVLCISFVHGDNSKYMGWCSHRSSFYQNINELFALSQDTFPDGANKFAIRENLLNNFNEMTFVY